MPQRAFSRGLLWPASILAAVSVAFVLAAPFYFANRADHAAAVREEIQVANGLDQRVREIAQRSVAESVWDEAVRNLDNAYDPAWAESYVGSYFFASEGFETALVLDRDGRVIYAMLDGETVDPIAVSDVRLAVDRQLEKVRVAEAAAAPLAERVAQGRTLSDPILSSSVEGVGERVFILTATLVQPDFGAATPLAGRAPIVVTGDVVDEAFAAQFADRYLLEDPHFHVGWPEAEPGRSRAGLRNSNGRVVATVEWRSPTPGAALLSSVLPPTLIVLIAVGGLTFGLYRRGRHAARALVASEARATHVAYHDALTGLPNRALLADRLTRAIDALRADGTPFAVHCIDLDRFKNVNDTFGHAAGDEVVRQAARELCTVCGPADTLARLGGDEFAIVQANASPEAVSAMASRVVELLAQPFEVEAARIHLGASVGATFVQDVAINASECLRQADLALYQAKDGGRGRHALFQADIDTAVRARRALQHDLREALASDALHVVYQPQVNGRGKVFGLETLVRWDHPTQGRISPTVFVPLAEEAGLIDQLGFLTLRRAFEDSYRWPSLTVAINVSASQLRRKDFALRLARLVLETRVPPSRFELEITEGLLLGDDQVTHDTLRELRRMGFHIALDDFGTGYSSLSYLQRYPINKIKIDRSFVANLDVDEQADAVISAIVRLARALGLSVIAEGVETDVQRTRLSQAGCSDFQGFLYARPASADDIAVLLDNEQKAARKAQAA